MVRLPWMKEFDVKIPMIMLVAGAAIALTAPFANAAATKKVTTAPAHKVVKHGKTATHVKTTKPAGTLGTTATPRPPLYIVVPGYSGPAVAPDPTNECMYNGVDCTDAQLCQYWGANCSTGFAPTTDQTGASSGDQSGGTQPAATVSTAETQSDSSELPAASSGDAQSGSQMASDDSSDDC
jgi:hypothetical protein